MRKAVGSAHAAGAGHGRPVWPHVGAYQSASGADHPVIQVEQCDVVGEPIEGELGAVIAPGRIAVDEQIAAAMATDVAHGDGLKWLARAGHTVNSISRRRGWKSTRT
jgi:hypothetical protein